MHGEPFVEAALLKPSTFNQLLRALHQLVALIHNHLTAQMMFAETMPQHTCQEDRRVFVMALRILCYCRVHNSDEQSAT